jgi:putative ABC transport system substrate-binding protein
MQRLDRRKFVSLLGGAATWPAVAGAQWAKPVVGFVNNGAANTFTHLFATFRRGLAEAGFAEGQVDIEDRWAGGDNAFCRASCRTSSSAG